MKVVYSARKKEESKSTTLNPLSMNSLASKLRNDRIEFKMKNALGGYLGKENRMSMRNGFMSQRSIDRENC